MTVRKPDTLHSLNYAYSLTLDEDAGRATDDFGAYLIRPYEDGSGYGWEAQWPPNGSVTWATRYDIDTSTLQLSVQDWSSDRNANGSSSGVCTAA